jgi:DNA (cytosine-5)-methyltransferase 1
MNELALFAGAGGGILGGKLLGWRTVCAVEWEKYPACVLAARQNEGILSPFPIWDDVQTFDGKPWRGIVDVVSGGFPCQDISAAGKGGGITGSRSSMWKHMARIIGEIQPKYCFVENSPMLTSRGLGTVLGDLAEMGFDAEWGVLSAADVGANHQRERIWIVGRHPKWQMANANLCGHLHRQNEINSTERRINALGEFGSSSSNVADTCGKGLHEYKHNGMFDGRAICGSISKPSQNGGKQMAVTKSKGLERWNNGRDIESHESRLGKISWSIKGNWLIEPNVGRVANGVAARVDRLKAIGNGQVPLCAATAWKLLNERFADREY